MIILNAILLKIIKTALENYTTILCLLMYKRVQTVTTRWHEHVYETSNNENNFCIPCLTFHYSSSCKVINDYGTFLIESFNVKMCKYIYK